MPSANWSSVEHPVFFGRAWESREARPRPAPRDISVYQSMYERVMAHPEVRPLEQ